MSLEKEVSSARQNVVTDGYEMSIGEIISLYRENELVINPVFQRLFRWSNYQKTRFIESLLLGIPIPPIFVYQKEDGTWELVDGLQRLSTIFEFVGILKGRQNNLWGSSILDGTKLLPSLHGRTWDGPNAIDKSHKLDIRRSRIRVEILKKESDPLSKFELFQRLNTGGSNLSEQEVRNAIMVMVNPGFYTWINELSKFGDFVKTTSLTSRAKKQAYHVELALRFVIYRNIPYESGLDVHEYLDDATVKIASENIIDRNKEEDIFKKTFRILNKSLGMSAFRRWDGSKFSGQFLISAFEAVAVGVSQNIDHIEKMSNPISYIESKIIDMWSSEVYSKNSGGGVRGTTRLANLIPEAKRMFGDG